MDDFFFNMQKPPFAVIRVRPTQTKASLGVHCTQELIPMSSPIISKKYESEIGESNLARSKIWPNSLRG